MHYKSLTLTSLFVILLLSMKFSEFDKTENRETLENLNRPALSAEGAKGVKPLISQAKGQSGHYLHFLELFVIERLFSFLGDFYATVFERFGKYYRCY